MQDLPNHCRVGKFSVFPSNWKTATANVKAQWRIIYWFYDDNLVQKKQVCIKGMNHLTTLKEKQRIVKLALQTELDDLLNGYNPITNVYAHDTGSELSEESGLLKSLLYAFERVEMEHNTRIDVKGCLKYLQQSISMLRYENIPIKTVMPRQIKEILDGCAKIKTYTDKKGNVKEKKWGAYQFNRNRTYLSLLFSYLGENFILQINPVIAIKKKPLIKRIRETLSSDERIIINDHRQSLGTFYRFIQIFYHSGSRIVELLRIKKEDVRIAEQKFKVLVKKGKKYQEEWRTIKTIALPYWKELINEAAQGEYLFAEGLKPALRSKPIRSEQITRRWRLHVKNKLGITSDIYALKHLNLDQIAALFGVHEAQEAAGHSTPVITMTYLKGEPERNHQRLKDAGNEF